MDGTGRGRGRGQSGGHAYLSYSTASSSARKKRRSGRCSGMIDRHVSLTKSVEMAPLGISYCLSCRHRRQARMLRRLDVQWRRQALLRAPIRPSSLRRTWLAPTSPVRGASFAPSIAEPAQNTSTTSAPGAQLYTQTFFARYSALGETPAHRLTRHEPAGRALRP